MVFRDSIQLVRVGIAFLFCMSMKFSLDGR